MKRARKLAAFVCLAVGAYALVVRPRLLRWGATDDEVRRPYPGADLIPGGTRSATMAVTIDAPPARVWPWLVQMGYGRAGWYSWDHLDNWGRASAARLHPEWQAIAVGDHLPSMPDDKAWWEVAALEPERFLGLRAAFDLHGRPFDPRGTRPRFSTDSLWGFLLEEVPGRRTRLVVSGYWALRPRWLQAVTSVLCLEPAHWIMQTRQFAKLQRLAKSEAAHPDPAERSAVMRLFYRDWRPTRAGRWVNRLQGWWAGLGLPPRFQAALEVRGRASGRRRANPVVIATVAGERYLVSMLGPRSDWVKNVEAAHGDAVLRQGRPRRVHLVLVPPEQRAPILREYVRIAPSGRQHVPLPVGAPLSEFEGIAERYPVYQIDPM